MPLSSHLKASSRLKALGLAATLLAGPIVVAQAEIAAPRPATNLPIDAGIKPWPAPTGHRQPRASDVPDEAGQDAVIRNEEEFDRKLEICRRC